MTTTTSSIQDSSAAHTKNNTEPTDSPVTNTAIKYSAHVPLRVIIDNLSTNEGEVEIGVYTPENKFPDEKDKFKKYRFQPKSELIDVLLEDLPYGELALAVYHDENNNGKIDKNFLGIPTEPYAFSNNFKPSIKAPSFDNCKFSYNELNHVVRISLINKRKPTK